MLKFDEKKYLQLAEETVAHRKEIEGIADNISESGFENIFFISSGGSVAIMFPYEKIIKRLSKIPVFTEIAGEIVLTGNQQLTKNSLVITASKSGDTKETVKAIEYCKEKNIRVVSFVGDVDSKLAHLSDYVIHDHSPEVEHSYMNFHYFIFRILKNAGDFKEYDKFVKQLEKLPELLVQVKKEFDPTAQKIAKVHHKDPYQIWVGGGLTWGDVYLFSMCVLEEMQWIRTKSVTSAEFFHGTLEIVEEDVPVFLVKGEDETRPLDDRVEKFLNDYTEKGTIIDTKDFALEGIDNEFRKYISPLIIETILTERLAVQFEHRTGHDLDFRRYYRQFDY
ncbi:SIS domain-containing protein [Marinilactibacillus psychrotolerans]|uniref:Fructosamine deglycase n=1 Tax=Marinilactibacillus psychrotolerans TaxID=191770 RepID=A0A5R9C2N2_9LACT|nr:SIS domain-containing protein [Marinilactibacillus psychrotolerans]TLQ06946.1 SIS domain-containing protein [Marinilactibacillus psychrotolerans]